MKRSQTSVKQQKSFFTIDCIAKRGECKRLKVFFCSLLNELFFQVSFCGDFSRVFFMTWRKHFTFAAAYKFLDNMLVRRLQVH
jgi:hypothetical protein